MKHLGAILCAFIIALGARLGWQTYQPFGLGAAPGMALGAASLAAMSMTWVLATRPVLLEPLFGGLDRMYSVHKWLGISALALMIGHDLLEPELDHAVHETNLGELASDLGEFAFNGLIGLLLLSWIRRIPFTRLELPWPVWRFTHRFTGLLFAIAAFHQLAIDKPAGLDPIFDTYMNLLSVLGILAWVFTQAVAPFVRSRQFEVTGVSHHANVTQISLMPTGRSMHWRPGQFAFVSLPGTRMSEAHPFTIASAPDGSGRMTFAIKALGDWTRKLPARLHPGQQALVEGPYGQFRFRPGVPRQVWLAGGVGITPFLAWAQALRPEDTQEIVLIWSVAKEEDAFARDLLDGVRGRHPRFTFHLVVSATQGKLTAAGLIKRVPFPVNESELFYCGPEGLLRAIETELRAIGRAPGRIHQEAFAFR